MVAGARGLLESYSLFTIAVMIAGSTGLAGQKQRVRRSRATPSGQVETITGRISLVEPGEGILTLVQTGPSQPPAMQINWGETRDPLSGGIQKSPPTPSEVPGETDYAFKVVASTRLMVHGRPTSLDHLVSFRNRPATVRFQARKTGDFALEIKVGD